MLKNPQIRTQIMKSILKQLTTIGFRKKGNTFIRETEKGLYQIIDFQLGPSVSSVANHIDTGFGVTTEEWITLLNTWKRPNTLTSADCAIRDINCSLLATYEKDMWLPISYGVEILTKQFEDRIIYDYLPYLNKMVTRKDITTMWRQYDKSIGLSSGHLLPMGLLIYLNFDKVEGEKILNNLAEQKYCSSNSRNAIYRTLGYKQNLFKLPSILSFLLFSFQVVPDE